jgi:hypothetical protein
MEYFYSQPQHQTYYGNSQYPPQQPYQMPVLPILAPIEMPESSSAQSNKNNYSSSSNSNNHKSSSKRPRSPVRFDCLTYYIDKKCSSHDCRDRNYHTEHLHRSSLPERLTIDPRELLNLSSEKTELMNRNAVLKIRMGEVKDQVQSCTKKIQSLQDQLTQQLLVLGEMRQKNDVLQAEQKESKESYGILKEKLASSSNDNALQKTEFQNIVNEKELQIEELNKRLNTVLAEQNRLSDTGRSTRRKSASKSAEK